MALRRHAVARAPSFMCYTGGAMNPNLPPGVIIYDGACPLCLRAVAWLKKRMVAETMTFLACQSPERRLRFPEMPDDQCLEAMQFVLPDGRTFAGAEALPHILRRLRGWRWFAWFIERPGVRHCAPCVYRWVARHRYTLAIIVTPKGAASGPSCDSDRRGNCE